MNKFGYLRVAVLSPIVKVGNPDANIDVIWDMIKEQVPKKPDVILLPELAVTGYTCANLFQQAKLLEETYLAIAKLSKCLVELYREKDGYKPLVVIGAPIAMNDSLYNCAVVMQSNKILGIVPKQFLPNYREFYELRWFRPADGTEQKSFRWQDYDVPFGTDLLFENGDVKIGIEICEDLWMPIPPSSYQALAGATVLLNCSASNEIVAKASYRRDLVVGQSARCMAAYAYSSCGPTESTTDVVFGGHCLISENGTLLQESNRIGTPGDINLGNRSIIADIDIDRLLGDRRGTTSFDQHPIPRNYRKVSVCINKESDAKELFRFINGTPFIPKDADELNNRCAEIFGIQVAGLAQRLKSSKIKNTTIGVSGGLDSTLALLVAVKTYQALGLSVSDILGLTMPGFGTTKRTKNNALNLMNALGISSQIVDIRSSALQAFKDMKHDPFGMGLFHDSVDGSKYDLECFEDTLKHLHPDVLAKGDLVFENVQARLRTFFLMSKGFVIGTGDLSEAALGWCTYNGDHMSMYNVNCSIPKTLVKFLVNWVAINEFDGEIRKTLLDIVGTKISPELLPPNKNGEIDQCTEDILGPYELHDFFLVNFVRYGYSPEKILYLASQADFGERWYTTDEIHKTLKTFINRFFVSQFKRSCVPDGPKVGSVSLSPRGDWRMPSDADRTAWLKNL